MPVGNHSNIPFSRVNHSKFMVTDKTAYVGEWLGQDVWADRELDKRDMLTYPGSQTLSPACQVKSCAWGPRTLVKNQLHLNEGLPCPGSDGSTEVSALSCPSTCSKGHSTGHRTAGDTGPGISVSPSPSSRHL